MRVVPDLERCKFVLQGEANSVTVRLENFQREIDWNIQMQIESPLIMYIGSLKSRSEKGDLSLCLGVQKVLRPIRSFWQPGIQSTLL